MGDALAALLTQCPAKGCSTDECYWRHRKKRHHKGRRFSHCCTTMQPCTSSSAVMGRLVASSRLHTSMQKRATKQRLPESWQCVTLPQDHWTGAMQAVHVIQAFKNVTYCITCRKPQAGALGNRLPSALPPLARPCCSASRSDAPVESTV